MLIERIVLAAKAESESESESDGGDDVVLGQGLRQHAQQR